MLSEQNSKKNHPQLSLKSHISYLAHRHSDSDLKELEDKAKITIQRLQDKAKSVQKDLEEHQLRAKEILENIRTVSAAEGVTKQASFFETESNNHKEEAKKWGCKIVWVAVLLAIFSVISIFLHKWPFLTPATTFETVQLVSSKLLIFGLLTYLLILCSKNYLNHKHNEIVNKHRQNALMTYQAMVDATDDPGSREAILIQAASCIFNPQSTGYSANSDTPAVSGKSMVEILSKPVVQAATGSIKP